MMLRTLFMISALPALGNAAAADTAYIEPSSFGPSLNQTITVETAFNDYCCVPKYPVRSGAFAVIQPDGQRTDPDRIETFANSTILEQKIERAGTTRFTTGERLGRKGGEYVQLDGVYHMINSDEADPVEIPDGTRILSSQTATVSDTYVTIGEATWDSINAPIGRLQISPRQHPSTLRAGARLDVDLFFDGAALPGHTLLLTRSGQKDRVGDKGIKLVSDDHGRVEIPLQSPGTHLIMIRMQADAPEGAETDIRSYTTSLTFNVDRVAH